MATMNRKAFLLIIPTILLPYLALFTLATIFFSTRTSLFRFIIEKIFCGNMLYLVAAFVLLCVITAATTAIFIIFAIRNRWNALKLAKVAMVIKLIQIPAYIMIFVLGFIFMFTIFTFVITLCLILVDCFILLLTGLLTTASVINAVRQGDVEFKEVVWVVILQTVFCADVIATVLFYRKLKN